MSDTETCTQLLREILHELQTIRDSLAVCDVQSLPAITTFRKPKTEAQLDWLVDAIKKERQPRETTAGD